MTTDDSFHKQPLYRKSILSEQWWSDKYPSRIGYACLNTILRVQKPPIFCSRTARISTIKEKGIDYLKELGKNNIQDLEKIILWNEQNGIQFMRMSSDMFPFASHAIYGYSLDYCKDELKRIGDLAKSLNHRLTTHPGQTNNLGSPTHTVVDATN
jgi:UV DNA damage endonuclease